MHQPVTGPTGPDQHGSRSWHYSAVGVEVSLASTGTMKKADFKSIESEEQFVELLKKHTLYREDDVTFESLGAEGMYVYSGDDFRVDEGLLADMGMSALLIVGNVEAELLSIGTILCDYGVFCVTGDLRCRDMHYCTESTGVSIGGNLEIENLLYADCGNSVLQVNGDLRAKLAFISQCSVDILGSNQAQFDEDLSVSDLASIGLPSDGEQEPDDIVRAYFEALAE